MWNCRGAGSRAFIRVCKAYLRKSKPANFVVIETKMDLERLRKIFKHLGFDGYVFSEVRENFGGICLTCKTNKLNLTIINTHFQFIHSKIEMSDGRVVVHDDLHEPAGGRE